MGILKEPADFIRALPLPNGFSVCELGDQYITHGTRRLAAEFYRELGCKRYEAIDANGRGTFTHDLNVKWTHEHWLPFDLVTDFGTGEHVFNQAQVWRTLHVLVKPGGFIVFDRPASGYPEHGFYNIHETLLLDIAEANRYDVRRLERTTTTRGELLRGVFRKRENRRFQIPQQGRYQKSLVIQQPATHRTAAVSR